MSLFPEAPDPQLCDAGELVALARRKDSDALDRMTRCYGARLVAIGRAHCGDRGGDAVQDALVSAAENLDQFRGDGSLEGWLARMVINACRRMQRGRKNDPGLHRPDRGDDTPGAGDDPEVETARAQLTASLGDALADLAPDDRAAVLLADVEGWTTAEIAAALGMTPGQTRTRLSRSRKRLRELLEPVWRSWTEVDTLSGGDGSTE